MGTEGFIIDQLYKNKSLRPLFVLPFCPLLQENGKVI